MANLKLFTHTDLDGVGCAILAKMAFGDRVDISFCDYDNINDAVKEFIATGPADMDCHITDISVNEEVAELIDLVSGARSFTLLDHHQTATHLNKYDWAQVDIHRHNHPANPKTCGTELYYDWLIIHEVLPYLDRFQRFVDIVRDYDTWVWPNLGDRGLVSKQFNDLLGLYGRDDFIDWMIGLVAAGGIEETFIMPPTEHALLDVNQHQIDKYIEMKDKQLNAYKLFGMYFGVVFAERYFSELGNKLSERHPELDFIAMIDVGNNKISFRTVKDNVNMGAIAGAFGGGGHRQSAGSIFESHISRDCVERILNRSLRGGVENE